ncbi:EAL domain-containing protein [Phormidium sp. LEGE 05292]|uniref:EAL domain-containing protein n=1 Tax=[Phormidium] sp. LEGE 05292 TaxID=767427 RepID=UPI00187F10D6|nr:EAL domain-containing protein [Phormidium sp. LEGE 05292]MBE9226316.1 EAL domain-containing protein [Phormidium sp. LEGE 05292]
MKYLHIIAEWTFVLFTAWLLYYSIGRLQRQLQQNKQEYYNLFNHTVEGIYQVLPSGKYINANLALAHIYGYTAPEEVIANCNWQELDVDYEKRENFINKLYKNGTVYGEVFEIYRRDRSIICVVENACAVRDSLGKLLYYQGTVQEINNIKKSPEGEEEFSEDSNTILMAVIEGMTDAVFVKNHQGRYLMTNEPGARFLGKSVNQLLNCYDWELFPREVAQQIRQSDRLVLSTGETMTYEQNTTILDKNNLPVSRSFIVSKSVYHNSEGKTLGLISIAKDITDYKQVKEEKSQLLEQVKKDIEDLAALTEATTNSPNTIDLKQLLDTLLQQIVEVLSADTAVILLAKNGYLHYTNGVGVHPEISIYYEVPVGEGFAGTIAKFMEPLYVKDTINAPTLEVLNATSLTFILEQGIHTMLGVPLKRNGNCIGVIHLGWCQIHPYNERELHLLEITAERCAMAIVNTELYEQTQRLQKLRQLQIERMPIGFILTDPDFHFLDWNPAAETIFGFTKEEILGKHIFTIVPESAKTNFGIVLLRLSKGDMTAHSINENITKAEKIIICEWRNTPLQETDGTIYGHLFMVQDITELRKAQEERLRFAFYDPLTGLPNRAWFLEHLGKVLQRKTEDYSENIQAKFPKFAVLFLNLERFEIVKYSLGHLIADQLLIATARHLENCLRPTDKVAYLGRDEFVILLEDIADAKVAKEIANRIYQQLSLPFNLDGHEIFSSASIGIAISSDLWNSPDYQRPEDFLRAADTAMHSAKGSRTPVVFETDMYTSALSRLQLDTDLRRAIALIAKPNNEVQEFELYYQPIVCLKTDEIKGFEALIRWNHPNRGLVSPAEFIPVAEESRLIIPLGLWILRTACQQLRIWQRQFQRSLTMSVNLSGIQLEQANLTAQIEGVLGEVWIAPNTLKLEITESTIMKNTESVPNLLNQIKQNKVLFAIDDFGTGYSSLSYLHRFPIDTLKIDRSFVSRMSLDEENLEIVRLIVTLAHTLGMDVTAEGVEDLEQIRLLKSLGCEYGQGYFFAKPLNKKAATEFLEKKFRNPILDLRIHKEVGDLDKS